MIQTFEHRWTPLFGFTPGHNVSLPYYGFKERSQKMDTGSSVTVPQSTTDKHKRRVVIDPLLLSKQGAGNSSNEKGEIPLTKSLLKSDVSKGVSHMIKISTPKAVIFIPVQTRTRPSNEKKTFPFQQKLPNANFVVGFSSSREDGYVFTSEDDGQALRVHCTSPSKTKTETSDAAGMLYTMQLTMQQYAAPVTLKQGHFVQSPTLVSTCLWCEGGSPLVLDLDCLCESVSVELCDGRSKSSIIIL
jgi:hypothetical protein